MAGMAELRTAPPALDPPAVRVEDFEPIARANLPKDIYDYFAGGAEDEATVAGNRDAFQRWRFRFKVLTGASDPDLRSELFGRQVSMPVQLAAAATQKMAHPEGELAAASAATAAGVIYNLSTLSTLSLEAVAAAEGMRWFQLYVFRDRGITTDLVDRAAAAGYQAIVLTVDTPVLGRRERDLRNAFSLPAGFRYENLVGGLAKSGPAEPGQSALAKYFNFQLDHALTFKDLEWLVGHSELPVLVKGVVRADDARQAVASGAQGVIVSNHGGRQLDYSIATLDALPAIVQEIGPEVPVLLDGGVRRGTDVVKALALGARSVMIGRPYLWALAAGGEDAVRRLLTLMRDEIAGSMTLLGIRRLSELSEDLLART
jgi:4-hydroxymandelate oxidase